MLGSPGFVEPDRRGWVHCAVTFCVQRQGVYGHVQFGFCVASVTLRVGLLPFLPWICKCVGILNLFSTTALTIEMLQAMPMEDALLHAFVADFLHLPERVLQAHLSLQRPQTLHQDIFRFLKHIRDDQARRSEVLDHYVLMTLAQKLKMNIFVASYQRRTQEHALYVGCPEDVSLSSTVVLICLNSDYYCIAEDRQAFFELVSVERVPYRVYADNMHITHATSIPWQMVVDSHQFGTPAPTTGGRNEEPLEIAP